MKFWKTSLVDFEYILCPLSCQCVRFIWFIPVPFLGLCESSAAKQEQVLPLYRTKSPILQVCWPLALRRWGTGPERLKETHSLDVGKPLSLWLQCLISRMDILLSLFDHFFHVCIREKEKERTPDACLKRRSVSYCTPFI